MQAAVEPSEQNNLDTAILRFWHTFVTAQIAAGRRDVGRMLEVALGQFFEWGVKNGRADQDKHVAVDRFLGVLSPELLKAQRALKASDGPRMTDDSRLPQVYYGVMISFNQDDIANATQVVELKGPLQRRAQLVEYVTGLERQKSAGEQIKGLLTQKLIADRKMVAHRLKVLSPRLYEMGAALVAAAPPLEMVVEDTPHATLPMQPQAQLPESLAWRSNKERMTQLMALVASPFGRHQLVVTMSAGIRLAMRRALHWGAGIVTPYLEKALSYAAQVRSRRP